MNFQIGFFNKVSIIGFGLIGSSLARAIKNNKLAQTIACGDDSPEVCKKVLDLKLADTATTDLAAAVEGADLVILAVPVGACGKVAKQIAGSLSDGAIVTDVGSVKQMVINAVSPHLPPHVSFVPAHPIAGTEHSGPEAGFAELFTGRWCILTPLANTPPHAVEKVSALWKACGAQIDIMDPKHHDLVLAITSHLPHLIAYSIVDTAATLEEDTKAEVIKYSASGFRDFTRIAASDPVMWRDIFLNNKEAVLSILQRFTEDLTALQKAIRIGDGGQLQEVFTRTRAIRRAIIDAKQATPTSKE
jgi:cyclohexadieny/prephenate dehydrogenase